MRAGEGIWAEARLCSVCRATRRLVIFGYFVQILTEIHSEREFRRMSLVGKGESWRSKS